MRLGIIGFIKAACSLNCRDCGSIDGLFNILPLVKRSFGPFHQPSLQAYSIRIDYTTKLPFHRLLYLHYLPNSLSNPPKNSPSFFIATSNSPMLAA
jgi:hypothetical protein